MTRKFGKHPYATYGTLNSSFDPVRSHQQCILWSPPLEIELSTPKCRSRNPTTGSPVPITHKRCQINLSWWNARPLNQMCLEGTCSLQRTQSPLGLRLPKSVLWIHITSTSWAGNRIIILNKGIDIHIYICIQYYIYIYIYIYIYNISTIQ